MDELTRFEYRKKAVYGDIALDVLAKNHVYEFRRIANDEAVQDSGEIMAADSLRHELLTEYVKKYGYDAVNEFVKAIIARMPQKGEEE